MRATASPVAAMLEPGYRVDRYELLAKIGQGGMASVWLARAADEDAPFVAIKTILPEHSGDDQLRKMMLDEAQIAMGIDHPNVARTLEVGQLFDMPYLVLEYVPGESLDQLCKALASVGATMPPAIAVRLIAETCRGLHAAHRLASPDGKPLEIVHRDLSPHNILVDDHGHVKLIDFGIAKANARLTETASGLTKGKIPYMAPEQALGGFVDHRADLWSLGAVLYVLLTGVAPFDGANDATRLMGKLSGDPPEPLPDSVPEALRAVVERTLSFYREARYASAEELADALEAAVPMASAEEVAAYFAANLAAAVKARKHIVEHALTAATTRNRTRELLNVAATPSSWRTIRPRVEQAAAETLARAPSRAPRAAARPWTAYVSVAAIAFIILLAYVLGRTTTGPKPVAATIDAQTPALLAATATTTAAPATTTKASVERPSPRTNAPLPVPPAPSARPSASAAASASAAPSASAPPRASASARIPEDTIF